MSNSVRGMQHFALSDTLCPTWASVPMFSFCYKSNISLISCRRPVRLRTSDSAQWPRRFCIIGQLVPNLAERSDVFPFCYDSNISLILQTSGRTPDVRICAMAAAFLYYRTTRAQLGRVFRCFSFHNISPFLLPDLFSSLPCLSN